MDPTTSPTLQATDDRSDRLCAGRVIGGKYQLDRPLGEGGMGVVWYATHLGLDAPVAIKLLNAGVRAPARLVDSFLHEAQAAAAVRHRNVVSTTDFGTDADGRPFMVMELLEGTSLAERFDVGERLPIAELVDIVAQCLSGLAAVHAAGILHRDLKPENVFLVNDGDGVYPKVIDFGISRSLSDDSSPDLAKSTGKRRGAMLTNDSTIRGTPHYMSPEQAVGLPDVDQRADVYAVGVILYEGLTGQAPYDRPDVVALLSAIAHGGAKPVAKLRPEVGPALSAVVEKAMALREDRYFDAREMRAALLAAISATPPGLAASPRGHVLACPTIDAPTAAPVRRRKAKLLTAAVGVVALALGFALWGALGADGGDSPAQAQRPQTPREARAVRHFASSGTHLGVRVAEQAQAAAPPTTSTVAPEASPRPRAVAGPARSASRAGLGRVHGVFRDPGF